MTQVSRSRSRQLADSSLTRKSGTQAAGSSSSGTTYYWYNSQALSAAALPTSIVYSGVTISLTGITVHSSVYNGTTYYWYNITEVVNRVKTYATQLIEARKSAILTGHEAAMTTTSTYRLATASESISDIVTSDFKERSRKGEVIFSPCSVSRESTEIGFHSGFVTEPSWSVVSVNWGYTALTNHLQRQWFLTLSVSWTAYERVNFGVSDVILGALRQGSGIGDLTLLNAQSAINSAFAKVYDAELDVPVILAEAKKTYGMLETAVRRLAKLANDIKLKRLASTAIHTAQKPKTLAKMWLEYRYGWSPLVSDIRTALSMLSSGKTFSPRRTFRGWDDDSASVSINYTYTSGGFTYLLTGNLVKTKVAKAGVLTQIDLLGLSVARDYGALGGPGVVWELIPYSFVVDWLVDISGFLQSINPSAIIRTLGSWSTQISENKFSGTVRVTHNATGRNEILNFSESSYSYVRNVGVGATFINLDINLSPQRIVDAISLIVGRLR